MAGRKGLTGNKKAIMFVLDLFSRYQHAFGFVANKYSVLSNTGTAGLIDTVKNKYFNQFSGAEVYVKSGFCFADMELNSQNYNLKMGDPDFFAKNSGSSLFVGPPMISVSRTKTIAVTSPDRSKAEVVENFTKKSWEIKLKGVIVDMENHQYPKAQVKALADVFEFDGVFDVTCEFLNDLGIYNAYITDFDELTGVEGFEDTLSYSFTLRSTQPAEFFIN